MDTAFGSTIIALKSFAQILKAARHSANGKVQVVTPIAGLLSIRSPIAIVLAVSQFVVSSFYAQALWWFSHIRQKCREVFPFRRNFNAATAMILVLGFIGISAALPHVFPNGISSCFFSASSKHSVNSGFSEPRSTQATFSAGVIFSRPQVNAVFYSFDTAITFAQVVIWPWGFRENYKLAKSLANQGRFSSCHSISFFDAVSWRAGNAQYRLAAFQYAYSPSIYQG